MGPMMSATGRDRAVLSKPAAQHLTSAAPDSLEMIDRLRISSALPGIGTLG